MKLLLENLLFTVLVPGTVAVYVPTRIVGDAPAASGVWTPAAAALLLVGGAIYTWCVWDFASFGRGTPAPIDAPKKLVVRGLYRYSRNPMYLGVLSVIAGIAAWFTSGGVLLYGACVFAGFDAFIRFYEEPHLAGEFPAEYDAYRRRVGRWLPRLPRR